MTAPDYSVFQVGPAVFPLTTASGDSLLWDGDRALWFLLDFSRFCVEHYLGDRLVAEMSAAGMLLSDGSPITSAVSSSLSYDPQPYMSSEQLQFPLLAVYRKSVAEKRERVGFEDDLTTFGANYILPPLGAAQAERILPILGAVWKVLRAKTSQGWDPAYIPRGGLVAQPGPFYPPYGNLDELGLVKASFGVMQGAGSLVFPTLLMEGYMKERDNPPPQSVAHLAPYEGADVTTTIAAPDGTTTGTVAAISTAPPPTSPEAPFAPSPAPASTPPGRSPAAYCSERRRRPMWSS